MNWLWTTVVGVVVFIAVQHAFNVTGAYEWSPTYGIRWVGGQLGRLFWWLGALIAHVWGVVYDKLKLHELLNTISDILAALWTIPSSLCNISVGMFETAKKYTHESWVAYTAVCTFTVLALALAYWYLETNRWLVLAIGLAVALALLPWPASGGVSLIGVSGASLVGGGAAHLRTGTRAVVDAAHAAAPAQPIDKPTPRRRRVAEPDE